MIPVQRSKNKIIALVCLSTLTIAGLLIWHSRSVREKDLEIGTIVALNIPEPNNRATSSFALRIARIAKLPGIGNSNYRKDENHVYYNTDEIPNSDPITFEIIDETFAKDKNQVYSKGEIIPEADPATFIPTPTPHDAKNIYIETACGGSGYSLVFCYKKIEGADMETFEPLFSTPFFVFSRDAYHVFYYNKMILEADPETFAVHKGGKYGYTYWYDKNYIFVMGYDRIGIIKQKCDTLEQIGSYYLRCDDRVYYVDKFLAEADAKTMTPVGATANYAKDLKHVYFDGEIIADADAETFEIGDGINTKDKRHTYRFGKRIE